MRSILPKNIRLISGPGCPVCVTPTAEIDRSIEIAKKPDVILATFGDMLKVTGSRSSLEIQKAKGADIRILYSPMDALDIAKNSLDKEVVFMGVGFETTSPTIAATIIEAKRQGIRNYSVISAFKLIPPALKVLAAAKDVKIDGFILPGHVSAIIGTRPYEFLNVPGVAAGFKPGEILEAIEMLVEMINGGAGGRLPVRNNNARGSNVETRHGVSQQNNIRIQYKGIVRPEGNPEALKILYKVFKPADSSWRGIGIIPNSGLVFRKEFSEFDALKRFRVRIKDAREPKACACGDILKGKKVPTECKLFGKVCGPEHPVGPCMVSSEGACAAYYRYNKV